MNFICFNGKFIPDSEPVLTAANKGYRYGDGLFETMKVLQGKILLASNHFERLFSGLAVLKIKLPLLINPEKLQTEALSLCKKNKCDALARVRLSVFRGTGGIYEENSDAGYIIECTPLDETVNRLNENGLVTGIFTDGRKSPDSFSNLKSSSFLLYTMAAQYARENRWNDCFILNTSGCMADSTVANLFIIKNNKLITPSLSEGCVAGVMRQHLISTLHEAGMAVEETAVDPSILDEADEVFLTNAIKGIRWVRESGNRTYTCEKTVHIYNRFVKTIFT